MRVDVKSIAGSVLSAGRLRRATPEKGCWSDGASSHRRFEVVHIDFAGPLTKSTKGNSYVLSLVDRATGWMEMVPTPDRTTASAVEGPTLGLDSQIWGP